MLGTVSADQVTLDLAGGPFEPGATAAATGSSEIEFVLSLGAGTDAVVIQGGSGGQQLTLGSRGANLNGDDDGDDVISAAGGQGTGAAFPTPVTLEGEYGDDQLTGGESADTEDGGAGKDQFKETSAADAGDVLVGGNGSDTANYAARSTDLAIVLDGLADDGEPFEGDNLGTDVEKVTGGKGADTIDAGSATVKNVFKGGKGSDVLLGRAGDDTLNTQDGTGGNDTADGGADTDTCLVDTGDATVSCES